MSRLLVKLRSAKDTKYELEHHRQVQGLIYNLLTGSDYDGLHDKKGYKFFSFSQLFPFFDVHKGDSRNLIISSPNSRFISYLKEQIDYLGEIVIGAMRFQIESTKKFDILLSKMEIFSLISGTPIISRIQPYLRSERTKTKACWCTDYPISLFMKQLEDNLFKKYNEYHQIDKKRDTNETIFYKSKFLKQVSTKLFLSKQSLGRTTLVGTLWKFTFGECNPLLQFAVDAGLGELNSLGFGFMNVQDNEGRLVN